MHSGESGCLGGVRMGPGDHWEALKREVAEGEKWGSAGLGSSRNRGRGVGSCRGGRCVEEPGRGSR